MAIDFDTYLSPFSWRYGSVEMRHIWSEGYKRKLWRQIWIALAEVESEFSLVSSEQVADLKAHAGEIDILRALEIESSIHHDLMAELKVFAEQSKIGGPVLHLGATSMDIEDNADALRLRESLGLVLQKLDRLLGVFTEKIDRWADTPVMGFTHLQPAEPTTLGYRLSLYAQDLLSDRESLHTVLREVRGKGFKGAVGTGASYGELLGAENLEEFENRLSLELGLPFYPVAAQTYPRKQDYRVVSALAGLGISLYKFAFDLRLLQNPAIGELNEPFSVQQVGSSAMPFKRNPVNAEKINSLMRSLARLPQLAWDNAAHSLLERTLDDSANRRFLLPEAFLSADEGLEVTTKILVDLQVNESAIARNLLEFAPFAALERLLMGLSKAGADRQEMHAILREKALLAWQEVQAGKPNSLVEFVAQDERLLRYLDPGELNRLLDAGEYTGIAAKRAREFAQTIRQSQSKD